MPKFENGHPGGPGRPRGSRNIVNQRLDELAEAGADDLVQKVLDVATGGDMAAARLVLSRIWSAPKSRPLQVMLPEIDTPDDLLHAHSVVAEAVREGRLTAQDGASLAAMLDTHRRAFELVAQEDRIDQLDDRLRKYKDDLK